MSLIELDSVLNYLFSTYLPTARWWPWKGTAREVRVKLCEQSGDLTVLLLESGGRTFYLPLVKVDAVPEEVSSRSFCVNNNCYLEAEYSSKYLKLLAELPHARIKGFDGFSLEDLRVTRARPVTLGSTNAVAEYSTNLGDLVIKSYRIASELNLEVRMLERLTTQRYKYIPRLRAVIYFSGQPTGVLMDKIRGEADGGAPFYNALTSFLAGDEKSERTGLAAKLGVLIGEMHIALNKGSEDPFFSIEPVYESDVEFWCKRIESMASAALTRIDRLLDALSSSERAELEYWRGVMERKGLSIVEDAVSHMESMKHLYKGRIHQDLHLAQMVFTGDGELDFVVTDFEGEPGRSDHERMAKEPLLRDVATMIRSFHYLAHAAVENQYGLSKHRASLLMVENDPTSTWRLKHVAALSYSYVARIRGAGILSPREPHVASRLWYYVYPWVVERAIYELYYESLYRPSWISIPISGVIDALVYKRASGRM